LKSEVRTVASLALLYMVRMLGLFMVLPVLFIYGESYAGASAVTLGLALGVYGLTQAVFQIPLGMLSDFFGRKPIIVLGLLGRVLQGSGAIASTIMALVSDLTSDKNRSKAMAAIGASIGLSFMLSLILGPVLAARWGLSGIFVLAFALSLVGIGVLLMGVPSATNTKVTSREVGAVPSLILKVIKNSDLTRLNIGIFSLHAVLTAMFVAVPGMLVSSGVDQTDHGLVYLPVMLVSFLVAVPLMMAFEKRGKGKEVFLAAILLIVLSLIFLGLKPVLSFLLGLLFLFFVAFNLLEAMLPSLVSKLAPAGMRGTAMGVYSTSQFLGAFVGGTVGGLLVFNWGSSTLFFFCAAVCGFWLFTALTMSRPKALSNVSYAVRPGVVDLDLLSHQGVEDAIYIEDEGLVYMKVDQSRIDLAALKTLIAPYLSVGVDSKHHI